MPLLWSNRIDAARIGGIKKIKPYCPVGGSTPKQKMKKAPTIIAVAP
jgi:hypothetical protein